SLVSTEAPASILVNNICPALSCTNSGQSNVHGGPPSSQFLKASTFCGLNALGKTPFGNASVRFGHLSRSAPVHRGNPCLSTILSAVAASSSSPLNHARMFRKDAEGSYSCISSIISGLAITSFTSVSVKNMLAGLHQKPLGLVSTYPYFVLSPAPISFP